MFVAWILRLEKKKKWAKRTTTHKGHKKGMMMVRQI
jgi:hypothetical protein